MKIWLTVVRLLRFNHNQVQQKQKGKNNAAVSIYSFADHGRADIVARRGSRRSLTLSKEVLYQTEISIYAYD